MTIDQPDKPESIKTRVNFSPRDFVKYPYPEDEPLEEIRSRTDTPPGAYYPVWGRAVKPEWEAYLEGLKKPLDPGLPIELEESRLLKMKFAEAYLENWAGIELFLSMPYEEFVGYGFPIKPEPEEWHVLPTEASPRAKDGEFDLRIRPQSEPGFKIRLRRDDPEE